MSLDRHRLAVAPMMEWTDRHCRFFLRLISPRTYLYTEMVTADAVIHGDRERLLGFDQSEHPVALQLGGSDPERLSEAARIGEGFGYEEINLNIGCPSDRVQSGRFGACLMAEPLLVADCVSAMGKAVSVPVTVKCRIGIDDQDTEESLDRFIDTVADAGCESFFVHARKAWLEGLSPKENRDIPPLDYERVYRLKARRPELEIVINGGIATVADAQSHLGHVDGVMLGRAAYHDPYVLAEAEQALFDPAGEQPSRVEILERFLPYAESQLSKGIRLQQLTRHLLGLFHGRPKARAYRRLIAERAHLDGAGLEVLEDAIAMMRDADATAAVAAE
ncbi:tRNA dihydrouridine(20/20a) synthase DusA [Methyloligella solikamskensis]|uniref:tRNA-dihydrouridine(20/20a) synthase n=1 Tax=Methyloligella solikamskensis TaxID=1177756 RepID=A0ABW3JBM0_9HYPH